MKNITFKMEFRGKGFDRKLDNINEEHTSKPTQEIVTEISGPGIIYFVKCHNA